jgi:hypothetical protein
MTKITKEQIIQKLKEKKNNYFLVGVIILIYLTYHLGYISEEIFNTILNFFILI